MLGSNEVTVLLNGYTILLLQLNTIMMLTLQISQGRRGSKMYAPARGTGKYLLEGLILMVIIL